MQRRTFILSATGVLIAVGAGLDIALSDVESGVAKVLHKRLDYLKLDPEGVKQYAKDVVAYHWVASPKLRGLDALGPMYTRVRWQPGKKQNGPIRKGEERLCGEYLLSSDFFRNGADETKVVHYLGYFDGPRDIVPCSNPFARPVVPEAEQG
jgi:hypothetical protein